jgi:cytochrome o ubiquinol oxidase subunit 2
MHFIAKASTDADFGAWLRDAKQSNNRLSIAEYDKLSQPSQNNPVALYSSVDSDLYDTIVMKYMMPTSDVQTDMRMDY